MKSIHCSSNLFSPLCASLFALLILSAFSHSCRANEAAKPTDGLSFYLPFDGNLKSTIGAQADVASQEGTPLFVPGKEGQAFREGTKNNYFLYHADGNVRGDAGTVSVWIRPQWKKDDPHFHVFWHLHADGRFILYSPDGKQLLFLFRGKGLTDQQYTVLSSPIDWNQNEWHNVAATWRAGEVDLYMDGELKKSVTNASLVLPVIDKNSAFMIGDSYDAGYGIQSGMSGVADTDLDDFRIYDHALDASEIRTLAGKDNSVIKEPATPFVVVPKTSNPPNINGDFSFDQWKDAAGFTGFINESKGILSKRQSAVLLCYDNTNLYVATFSQVPDGAPLKSVVDRRDGPTYGDDSVELYLDPDNQRQDKHFYQFVGNSTGYFLDLKNGDSSWNGNWKYHSTIQGNWRGFGQTFWVTQLAIPFKDLGRNTPVNGEKWAANFARTWYTPDQEFTSWSWRATPNYSDVSRFGTLEFDDHAPAFEWTVLRDLASGQPALEGDTPPATSVNFQASAVGTGQDFINKNLEFDKQKSAHWMEPLDFGSDNFDTLKVQAKAGAKVLYSAELPYQIETQPIRVIVNAVPSQELLVVNADPVRFHKEWQNGGSMKVLLSASDGKMLQSKTIASTERLPAETRLSLHDVPPGNYQVQVSMLDKSGKTLATQNSAFVKPPTPVWMNNKIGITDKVLKPWTPIITTNSDLKMWSRDYQFGNNAFPQQVISAGENLLQSPARLVIDGKVLSGSTSKIDEKTDAKVIRSGTAQSGNFNINWKCTAEYDGFLWYEVTLTPVAGKSTSLNSMSLELPFRNETSGLYNASNGSYGLGGGESGATPANWKSGWKQVFWLGDAKAGLSWFAESDQHWNLADPHDALRFTRDDKSTLASVNFVTAPMNVSKPITYKFGLQATPTRPLPAGWRGWQWNTGKINDIKTEESSLHPNQAISWWMEWSPYISSPLDVKPDAAQIVEKYHQAGMKVIPYQALLALNEKAPDFDYFKAEWLNQPQMDGGGEQGQQTWFVNVKGSFQDYFLYALRQEIRDQHWDGMYFDFAQGAVPDRNQFHGSGYVDDKGVRHSTYDILAQREFFKRLWAMLQEETGNPEPIVMIHDSACVVPPIDSFANVYFDGEQFNFSPKVEDDYTKVLSRASFRAEFLGSNIGGVPLFLPETNALQVKWLYAKTEPEKIAARKRYDALNDTVVLYTLTHGTLFSPGWMDTEFLQPLFDGRREFDIGSARFYGYWEDQDLVTLSPNNPDVLASIYAHDDKLWLVVGNWTDTEQTVNAKLNLSKISPQLNAAAATTKNIWKDGTVTHDGNNFHFSVPPKSARIIEIGNQATR